LIGEKILKNVIHLFISNVSTRILSAVSIIILANHLGPEDYGIFNISIAFAFVAGYFTDVGMVNTVIREASKKDNDISAIFSTYIKLRLLLLIITLIFSYYVIKIFYGYEDNKLILSMFLLVFPMIIGLGLQSISVAYFQVIEEMNKIARIRIFSSLLSSVCIFLGIYNGLGLLKISFLYGFSYIIAGIYGLYLLNKRIVITFRIKDKFHKGILKGLSSFIISGLLVMLLPQLGPLILEKTLNLKDVGYFSVAQKMVVALYQIPGVIAGAFYPVLFRHFNNGDYRLHLELNTQQVKFMSIIGMILSIPLFFYPHWIIDMFLGEEWRNAANILKLLSLIVILQSINFPIGDGLTTRGRQDLRTLILAIATIGGCGYYYILSKLYGVSGAVVAAILIEVTLLLGFLVSYRERIHIIKNGLFYNILACLLVYVIGLKIGDFINFYLGVITLTLAFIFALFVMDRNLKSNVRFIIGRKG
jgi:O-antigen/teichoic acid export membrane protein